jgi:hypothetical protein
MDNDHYHVKSIECTRRGYHREVVANKGGTAEKHFVLVSNEFIATWTKCFFV